MKGNCLLSRRKTPCGSRSSSSIVTLAGSGFLGWSATGSPPRITGRFFLSNSLIDNCGSEQARQQHRHAGAIVAILVAKRRDEVAFLQRNADKDIDRSGGSEQQVPERHDGRSPECDQKAEIDRMPDDAIETGRLEADAGDGAADRVEHYLLHAE